MKKHNLDLENSLYSEKELEENIDLSDDWDCYFTCRYQILSEEFIEKHSDKLDWCEVCRYQNLSEEFIRKHFGKIKHFNYYLMQNGRISNEIKKEIETLMEII